MTSICEIRSLEPNVFTHWNFRKIHAQNHVYINPQIFMVKFFIYVWNLAFFPSEYEIASACDFGCVLTSCWLV